MTKDEAIDWIGKICAYLTSGNPIWRNEPIIEACDMAIDALKAEPQWIPCRERLPEKYGQYLVTFIPSAGTLWTCVLIARYSDLMGIAKPSFHIGNVGKNDFANITEQVTAWMPLPEPWRGESNDRT